MCHECEAALLNEIGLHGITEYKIERHGSHRTLLFTFREKPIRLVFGVNPSDRHHLQNALRDLRREMGVKRIIDKRPGDRRRAAPRLRRPTEAVTLPKLTAPPRPDPWAALRGPGGGPSCAGRHGTRAGRADEPHPPALPAVRPAPPLAGDAVMPITAPRPPFRGTADESRSGPYRSRRASNLHILIGVLWCKKLRDDETALF